MRSLQDQMRQMQHGQIPRQGFPARPPQMSEPPQRAYNPSEEDYIDLYYSTNGDQVFVSRKSTSSVNSSFVVPSEKYEKENPFQKDSRTSASLSSFDEQQQPSNSYFNQGMPAPPTRMSADPFLLIGGSRIPQTSSVPSFHEQQQPPTSYLNKGLKRKVSLK